MSMMDLIRRIGPLLVAFLLGFLIKVAWDHRHQIRSFCLTLSSTIKIEAHCNLINAAPVARTVIRFPSTVNQQEMIVSGPRDGTRFRELIRSSGAYLPCPTRYQIV